MTHECWKNIDQRNIVAKKLLIDLNTFSYVSTRDAKMGPMCVLKLRFLRFGVVQLDG